MDKAALFEKIKERFSDAAEVVSADPKFVRAIDDLQVKIPGTQVKELANHLRQNLGFDFLNFLTAVDYVKENRFEVVYHFLRSAQPSQQLILKVDLPRDGGPTLPSLSGLYSAADWQERETFDLFGIGFDGHPNPKRILLWDGYPGWPLRKDYVHTADKYDNGSEVGTPKAGVTK